MTSNIVKLTLESMKKVQMVIVDLYPSISAVAKKKKVTTMADKVAKLARPMKFPYTFSAKLAQFPFKFYLQKQWIWRYYAISLVVCLPVFNSISKLANSPENVAKWAEKRRKEAEAHH